MLKDKSIFVVEDNTMNRVVYTIMLKKEGCILEFDRWGRDTVSRLGSKKFDLVILDLMLPHGKAGFAIFDDIRQLPEYDDVPIIAVSASEPATAIPRAQELGFNGFIGKPIDKELFPEQLKKIFQGEKIWYAGERY